MNAPATTAVNVESTTPVSICALKPPGTSIRSNWIGNASLALHHHMAPADGGFELDGEPLPGRLSPLSPLSLTVPRKRCWPLLPNVVRREVYLRRTNTLSAGV